MNSAFIAMTSSKASGFFIAPFAIDGEQQGVGYYDCEKLSQRWLKVCADYLAQHGASFDAPWSGNLSHIRTRGTATSDAALMTFSVNGRIAASLALARGTAPAAEREVLTMFADSLHRLKVVQAAAASPSPFSAILSLQERPLMVVVPWPDETISSDDEGLVRELSLHTGGAFLSCGRNGS
jgi:hypothetical protein